MEKITERLSALIGDAFVSAGFDYSFGEVSLSNRKDLCQYQCNGSLKAAKQFKQAPLAIARQIAQIVQNHPMLARVEAIQPGFINLDIRDDFLVNYLLEMNASEAFGIHRGHQNETILLDFGGPNVAKPLHVGHLRSAIIGESIKRLTRIYGYTTIGDIHLGDWGLQMGLVITELHERYPGWNCFAEGFSGDFDPSIQLTSEMLNEVYPTASAKSKADTYYYDLAQQATLELQRGRNGYRVLWKAIVQTSVDDMKLSYNRLGVSFDLWYGESDADQYVGQLLEILTQKNLMRLSEGAMVVDVEAEDDTAPMPPVIIKKSNDSIMYATSDLATIIERQKDFQPQKIWYVVDNRQNLHFTQVFRVARKADLIPESTDLQFLGFGTMNGKDGKPYKTREGGIMRLSDLIDNAKDAAYEKLSTSEYVVGNELDILAEKVGVAAIKFGDLINHRRKDYIFDLDKFLAFEGKTGSYLLYSITRINSILNKVQQNNDELASLGTITSDSERQLMLVLATTQDVFDRALLEQAPNYIAENVYTIAVSFSKFYSENNIVFEKDKETQAGWISLLKLTRKIMIFHLDILGIETVENM